MSIKVGDKIPEYTFLTMIDGKPSPVKSTDLFKGKKVVLITIPGAFTPTCTNDHCPGFSREASQLHKAGVDQVFVNSVNDPFVMSAFGDFLKAKEKITFLAEDGGFAKLVGVDKSFAQAYMGTRSKRYAMIIDDGVVKYFGIDDSGLNLSSVEEVLKHL